MASTIFRLQITKNKHIPISSHEKHGYGPFNNYGVNQVLSGQLAYVQTHLHQLVSTETVGSETSHITIIITNALYCMLYKLVIKA